MKNTKRKFIFISLLLAIFSTVFFASCEKNENLVEQFPDQEAQAKDTVLASEDYNDNGNLKFSGSDLPPPVKTPNYWTEHKDVNNGVERFIMDVYFLQYKHYYYDLYGQIQTYTRTNFYFTVSFMEWHYDPFISKYKWGRSNASPEVHYDYWGENIPAANNTTNHPSAWDVTETFLSEHITYSNHPAVQHMYLSVKTDGFEASLEVNN